MIIHGVSRDYLKRKKSNMEKISLDIIGIIAGTLTTSSFIPQIVKIFSTKEVRDISLVMYVVLSTGIALWIVYGVFAKSLPIILANSVGLILSSTVIMTKIVFRNN